MIEQSIGRVAHGADHGHLVVDLGQLGKEFREMRTRNASRNALEDASHVIGNIGLGVPEVDVTRTTLEIDQNHALGPSPTGTPAMTAFIGLGLHLQHRAQG